MKTASRGPKDARKILMKHPSHGLRQAALGEQASPEHKHGFEIGASDGWIVPAGGSRFVLPEAPLPQQPCHDHDARCSSRSPLLALCVRSLRLAFPLLTGRTFVGYSIALSARPFERSVAKRTHLRFFKRRKALWPLVALTIEIKTTKVDFVTPLRARPS